MSVLTSILSGSFFANLTLGIAFSISSKAFEKGSFLNSPFSSSIFVLNPLILSTKLFSTSL